MAQPRKAGIGLAFILGIAGFCLVGVIALIYRGSQTPGDALEEKRAAERTKRLQELQDEAHQKLTQYAVVDKEKGVFRIPIERAMELTLNDLKAKGVSPSAEKAEIVPSLLVPPFLKPAVSESAPQEAAPAEGTTAPAAPAAAEPAAPAAPEAAPTSQPAPQATPAAAPAAPSEN